MSYRGYKLIAYELYKQMDELPDKIVVPICYGDALFGIMKGFSELKGDGIYYILDGFGRDYGR